MDVLVQLTQREIVQLNNLYKTEDCAPQICNFLQCVLHCTKRNPNLIRIYSPNGDFSSDGTFIAILEFNCYEIYMYTMEKSCKTLSNALKHTKLIHWKNDTIIYALHADLQSHIIDALIEIDVPISFVQENTLWMKSVNDSVIHRVTGDFYLSPLKESHAKVINELWPYRYEGSHEYIQALIEFNGGVGIFKRNPDTKIESVSDEMVAWVVKNGVAMLGILQTKPEYKRMGLGSWAVNALSEQMFAENTVPMCTIALGNEASQKTFLKCGFKLFAKCCYIGIGESSIAFDSEYDCGLQNVTDFKKSQGL